MTGIRASRERPGGQIRPGRGLWTVLPRIARWAVAMGPHGSRPSSRRVHGQKSVSRCFMKSRNHGCFRERSGGTMIIAGHAIAGKAPCAAFARTSRSRGPFSHRSRAPGRRTVPVSRSRRAAWAQCPPPPAAPRHPAPDPSMPPAASCGAG